MASESLISAENIGIASVTATVITFGYVFIYCKINKIDIPLQDLITRSLSASALPTSVIILVCAIDLSLLTTLGGVLQVYIALAGLSLLYVSLNAIFSPLKKGLAPSDDNKD